MGIGKQRKQVQTGEFCFEIARTTGGVIEIWGDDDFELAAGTGYAHMHDRAVQMMMVRAIGQGRVCEQLKDSEESLHIDLAMRSLDFTKAAANDVAYLTSDARRFAEAYSAGVNHFLEMQRLPLEFKLLRWKPEPWRPEDCLLCIHLMSYLGLAQSQQDAEKFIMQAAAGGVPEETLQYIFAPHLHELTPRIIALLKDINIQSPMIPKAVPFLSAASPMAASNNWAVSAKRSASGFPLECHDPHLESNRLPPVWAECVLHTPDNYRLGVNMPGLPGIAMGRTRDLSFGFTYGYMDMVDYFIEECRDGKTKREDDFVPLESRTETIKRRGGADAKATYWSSDRGVLECEALHSANEHPTRPNGLFLSRAFAQQPGGAASSLASLFEVLQVSQVAQAQDVLKNVNISANWVIVDSSGNIGYQQSGILPARSGTGLAPLPAWDSDTAWSGFVPSDHLKRVTNPPEEILFTANEDQNPEDGPLVVNLHHGFDRSNRIKDMLLELEAATVADMQRMQCDLYSKHAEKFLKLWRPLIASDTAAGRLLLDWDLCYNLDSQAPTLFEEIYAVLGREVLGRRGFGEAAWEEVVERTALPALFYSYFDRPLLREGEGFDETAWYGKEGWRQVTSDVIQQVLGSISLSDVPTWGQRQQVLMKNVLLGGKVPRALRFDYGPVSMPGGRGTIVQSVIYQSHGRQTNHFPSYRAVADLATNEIQTCNGGGPSGRAWSRYYTNEIRCWLAGKYKILQGSETNESTKHTSPQADGSLE
ncbi:MAG: penicillin acylase family protein [Pirellulales bacterium]|nr:penicillin acylase family protein [Pirellulales bacterium]